jgi:hypothetical protein
MRMRLIALSLALVGPAHAEPYHMTGEQLMRDMLIDAFKASPREYMQRERAMGYLDGLMDGTAGRVWCPKGSVPHELNYNLMDELSKRSLSELKGNAAPLVLDSLRKLYPCKEKR